MNKSSTIQKFRLSHWVVMSIISAFVFLLYGNTIGNKYCLDDSIVITRNAFVDKGISGIPDIFSTESFTGFFGRQKELVSGARYRPLSIATFAVEKQIFNGNRPSFSHFVNILLFAFTGFLIYLLLKKLLPKKPTFEFVPLITSLLFVFHPIHTEVVANIKGRDEIMALLFSLIACYLVLKYFDTNRISILLAASIVWLLGLLSKENAIVFWLLMPMILFLAGIKDKKRYMLPLLLFSGVAVLFLIIRHSVIGSSVGVSDELMNNSFLQATIEQKYATIFYSLWKYICLLVFPVNLTYDYYPYHVHLMEWDSAGTLLGLISSVIIVVWSFISFRKNTLIAFALMVYVLPLLLVSNLFFPIGTFMSERFLYFSSLGFCIIIALLISRLINRTNIEKYSTFLILAIILVFAGYKIINRNRAWYNDYTLFTTDVKTSYNSAKSNCSAGGVLLESVDTISDRERKLAILNQSIRYLKRSVEIHPKYFDAWLLLGNAYFKKEASFDSSSYCYTTILKMNPRHELAFQNLFAVVNQEKNVDTKVDMLTKMLSYNPDHYDVNYELGKLYGKEKNDLDKSILYLSKAVLLNPGAKNAFVDLGVAYGFRRDFLKSAAMLQKAIEIDPNDANVMINLGVTYRNLGEISRADECFRKAEALKSQLINSK
jgi:protein O-mannosyl-transferase